MDVVQAVGDLLPRVHVSAATADFTPFKPVFGTSGLPQSLACGSGNQILEIGVATAFRHSERLADGIECILQFLAQGRVGWNGCASRHASESVFQKQDRPTEIEAKRFVFWRLCLRRRSDERREGKAVVGPCKL